MIKRLFIIAIVAIGTLSLISCQSKEEKVINKMKSMIEKVEKDGANWDQKQWQEAFNEIEEISKEGKDCNFTEEQMQEVYNLGGRLTGIMMQQGAKAVSEQAGSYMEAAGSYLEGLEEGLDNMPEDIDF